MLCRPKHYPKHYPKYYPKYRSKIPSVVTSAVITLGLLATSCTTAQGAQTQVTKAPKSSKASSPAPVNSDKKDPPKVQPEFQDEFAREIAKSGPKSEGWALFSDSSMGHNGQRWIIRTNDPKSDKITLCVIKQNDKQCDRSTLSAKQFAAIEPSLKAGDKLDHILPVAFDAITFEYLHVHNSVPTTQRVVFITSAKPFPAEYESLIKAFAK